MREHEQSLSSLVVARCYASVEKGQKLNSPPTAGRTKFLLCPFSSSAEPVCQRGVAGGRCATNVRSKTPCSSYVSGDNKRGGKIMEKWECSVCGYIYDPKEGDPDNGVEPSTPFDKLPDNWICPVCGAGKDMFVKL